MNVDALVRAIGLLDAVLSRLKGVVDLVPGSAKKAEAAAGLERAERDLRLAEAETAEGLGYLLCRKHFPPGIMVETENDQWWECPECGHRCRRRSPPTRQWWQAKG